MFSMGTIALLLAIAVATIMIAKPSLRAIRE